MCLSPLIQFSIDEGIKGSLSSNKIKPYRFEEKIRKTGVTNDKNKGFKYLEESFLSNDVKFKINDIAEIADKAGISENEILYR